MTGIEIAGLVLGGYPVLVWTCEKYKDVFRGLEGWRAFRSRFEDFTLSLETQRLCYRDVLKSLLCLGPNPYLQNIQEAGAFLSDPYHEGWRSNELAENLKDRLGERYEPCVAIIDKLNGIMTELYRLLDIQRGQIGIDEVHPSSWWQEKLDRTKFSFSTKRFKKLAQLKTLNEDLERLIRNSDQLDVLRATSNPSAFTTFFKKIRDNASGLHAAIKAAWTCDCQSAHPTRLRLENRIQNQDPPFMLRFDDPNASKARNIRIEVAVVSVGDLGQTSSTTSKSVSFVASSVTTPAIPVRTSSGQRKKDSSNGKSITSQNSNQVDVKGSKYSKFSTFFHKFQWNGSKPPPSQISSRIPVVPLAHCFPDLPRNTHGAAILQQKKVDDLCRTMRSNIGSKIFYLGDNSRNYYLSETGPSHAENTITLRSLLGEGKLSKRQRILIASILASSLLQLQKTPWSANGWRKDHIWFTYDQDSSQLSEQPYITHSFPSTRTSHPDGRRQPMGAKPKSPFETVLIQFGILLLELCFDETIEARMARKKWPLAGDTEHASPLEYAAALEWSREVQDEFPDLQTPIERCLKESFGDRIDWGNPQFIQKVYANLAKPLRETLVRNGWLTERSMDVWL